MPDTNPSEDTAPDPHKAGPYQLFMLLLCVLSLVILAVDSFVPIKSDTRVILDYVDTGVCVAFLADFLHSLWTADSKLGYLKWGWIDLLSSIPTIEALRLGRAARILRIFRLLRGIKSAKALAKHLLRRRAQSALLTAVLMAILLILVSSILILRYEISPEANIQSAEDALWWSFVTVTTVGYGDLYPVTSEGRLIGMALMVVGVGLFGTLSGYIATWFLSPGEDEQARELEQIRRELGALRATLAGEDSDAG